MKTKLKELIFGVRAKGEPIPEPKFKTTLPTDVISEDKWVKKVKFGSRYGTRGSFYNN